MYLDREQYGFFKKKLLFIEPRGGLQSTLALFLAVIEFVSVCVSRKRRRRKPGAGPKYR